MGRTSFLKQRQRDFYSKERKDRHGIRILLPGKGKDKGQGEIVLPGGSCEVEREAAIDRWSETAI